MITTALTLVAAAPAAPQGWQIQTVDAVGTVGQGTAMMVGDDGVARIVYLDATNRTVKYAHNTGAIWHTEVVVVLASVRPPLYVDIICQDPRANCLPPGEVGFSYYDSAAGDLKYAHKVGGQWTIEVVDSVGDVGKYNSIGVDEAGIPHISYYGYKSVSGALTRDLKHAWRVGGGGNCGSGLWQCETIDSSGDVGWYTSLAFGKEPYPLVSYYAYKAANGALIQDLKFAQWVGSGGNCAGGLWQCDTVGTSGDVGRWSSLAVSAEGGSLIASYDATKGDLVGYTPAPDDPDPPLPWWCRLIRCPGPWPMDVSLTTVGEYGSLVFDDRDTIHVSYFDRTNGDLLYLGIAEGQPSWTPQRVDATGTVGQYNSIAVDSLGQLYISYFDATRGDLKYATLP